MVASGPASSTVNTVEMVHAQPMPVHEQAAPISIVTAAVLAGESKV